MHAHLKLAALVWLTLSTALANARDVPYLMKGPAAAEPIRVLWDDADASRAKLTVDFGAKYDATLTKAGFSRLTNFNPTWDGSHYVVNDPRLTRVVQVISDQVNKAIVGLSSLYLKMPTLPEPEVKEASITIDAITPANQKPGDKDYGLRLEAAIRIHVILAVPRPDGTLASRDFDRTERLVGLPEPLDPDDAARALLARFGPFIPDARKTSIHPRDRVKSVDETQFNAVLVRLHLDPAANSQTMAVVDRSGPDPISYIRPDVPPETSAHETTHLYVNPDFRGLGRGINEGLTHRLTEIATNDPATDAPRFDFTQSYIGEHAAARALLSAVPGDLVFAAFFGADAAPVTALADAVDKKYKAGTFRRFVALLGADESSKPSAEDFGRAINLISTGKETP